MVKLIRSSILALVVLLVTAASASAACNGLTATITGTSANDTINGTAAADVIDGLAGNDTINGLGANDTICGGLGADTINGGVGDDWTDGGAGYDTINGGAGNDYIYGGADTDADAVSYSTAAVGVSVSLAATAAQVTGDGTDTIVAMSDLYGGPFADTLTGSTANNAIYGLAGNDSISGSDGSDALWGGDGNDTIAGGLGNDTIRGDLGLDTADYSASTALTGIAADLAITVAQNTNEGNDTFVTIENVTGSPVGDVLKGNSSNNVLSGGAGDDTIHGLGGADTLNGDADNDTLRPDAGDDIVVGGAGFDIVSFEAATVGIAFSLAAFGPQVTGEGSDSVSAAEGVRGSAQGDTLAGDSADNQILAGDGDDVLKGGLGGDTLAGGPGVDKADYADAGVRIVLNLALTGAQATGEGSDTISGIENAASGSGTGDFLVGDAGPNTLWAGAGNDELRGGGGNDTLYTEAGADTLVGGMGDDVLDGGADADAIEFGFSPAGVTVDLSAGTAIGEGADTITAVEDIYGSPFSDTITGSPTNNYLAGVDGDDAISGAGGNDLLQGGAGSDTFLEAGATNGADSFNGGVGVDTVDYSSRTVGLIVTMDGAAANDGQPGENDNVGATVENVMGSSAADSIVGNGLANVLSGGDGADVLDGALGNDVVKGQAGDDQAIGGDGDDVIDLADGAPDSAVSSCGAGADEALVDAADNTSGLADCETVITDGVASNWSGTISLSVNDPVIRTDESATLTATISAELSGGYAINIYNQTTGAFVQACSFGTVCQALVRRDIPGSDTYVAYVSELTGVWPATGVQATSNPVNVALESYTLDLTASKNVVTTTEASTLTATLNQPPGGSYRLIIRNNTTGYTVQTCSTATCQADVGRKDEGQDQYVAYLTMYGHPPVAGDLASSPQVVSLVEFAMMMSTTKAVARTDEQITLTAQTNQSVTGTGLVIIIYNRDTNSSIVQCSSGTTCEFSFVHTQASTSFVAFIAPPYPGDPQEARAITEPTEITRLPYTCVDLKTSFNSTQSSGDYVVWSSIATYNQTVAGTGLVMFLYHNGSNLTSSGNTSSIDAGFVANPLGSVTSVLAEVDNLRNPVKVLATCGSTGGPNPATSDDCGASCDDPINMANGRFFLPATDLVAGGRGPGLRFERTYDASRAQQTGPMGYGWTHSYAMRVRSSGTTNSDLSIANEVAVSQENGSEVVFSRDANGNYSAAPNVLATLVREPNGEFTFVRKRDLVFSFNPSGHLRSITDPNGYATTVRYDQLNRVDAVEDPQGQQLEFTYDTANRITSVAGPGGRQVAFAYNGAGDLVEATDATGTARSFTYNASHWMTSLTDGRGNVTSNLYTASGQVYRQIDGLGREIDYAYGSVTTRTDDAGNVTQFAFDQDKLLRRTVGVGTAAAATTEFTYDPDTRQKASVRDGAGKVWTYTYDDRGNTTSATDPLNNVSTWTYDARDRVLTHTDAEGITTTNTWDASGNQLTSSTPLSASGPNAVTTWEYLDAAHPGDVTQVTDPEGGITHLTWSNKGDLVKISDPNGHVTARTYNAAGEMVTEVSPRGNLLGAVAADFTTTYVRDGLGRVTNVTDSLGRQAKTTYNGAGNVATTTAANGAITTYTYDGANQLTAIARPDGSTLQRSYTLGGLLASETDGNNKVTSYSYDAAGRRVTKTDPLNRVTSYTYDAAGRPSTSTDALLRDTTLAYDVAGRLTGVDYEAATTPDVAITYDDNGRRATMVDGTGTSTYNYNGLGHLTAVTNGAGVQTNIGRDKLGNVLQLTYPSTNRTVTYAYDDAGRMTRATNWIAGATEFAYDADGNWTDTTHPNGVTTDVTYNRAGQPTGIEHAKASLSFAQFTQSYDAVEGSLTSVASTGVPFAGTQSYDYDHLDRITTATAGPGAGAFDHDNAGNLTRLSTEGTLTFDAVRQLTTLTPPSGAPTSYSYNAMGQRLASTVNSATRTYHYDQAGRLTQYTAPTAASTTYTYNGDGIRTSKTANAVTRQHTWVPNELMSLLLDDGEFAYVYGPGGAPIHQIDSNNVPLYLHGDHLGSVRALTDSSGDVHGTASYTPFGTPTTTGITSRLGYTGQYTDDESGMQYLRARYYDPATGQFLTRDPIEDVTGDPYGYANGNPIMNTDPTGLFSMPSASDIAEASAGIGDAMSFGAFRGLRNALGGGVDECSDNYSGGLAAGTALDLATGGGLKSGLGAGFRGLRHAMRNPYAPLGFAKNADNAGGWKKLSDSEAARRVNMNPEQYKREILGRHGTGKYDLADDGAGGIIIIDKAGRRVDV